MKRTKLNYRFHNPNSAEDTADFLCKLLIEVNAGKVERAIEKTALYAESEAYILENLSENKEKKRMPIIKLYTGLALKRLKRFSNIKPFQAFSFTFTALIGI